MHIGETILTNTLFGAAPVLVFLLSSGLGEEWRAVRYVLLTVSVVCYIARMAIADYRQTRSADLVQRQASALDSAVDGMAIVDSAGKYTYVNAGYAQLLGNTTRKAMIGQSWQALSVRAGDGNMTSEQEIRGALQKDGKWYGIVEVPRGPGAYIPIELAVTLLADGGSDADSP